MTETQTKTQHEEFFDVLTSTKRNIQLKARAGTGKTYALLEGAKQLRRALGGISQTILAFNAPIAKEINGKIAEQGIPAACSTTHSAGNQILNAHRGRGVPVDDTGKLLLQDAQELITKEDVYAGRAIVSWLKNACLHPDLVDQAIVQQAAASCGKTLSHPKTTTTGVKQLLEQALDYRRMTYVSFDDMLYVPALFELKHQDPPDVLYVDEAQDLNPAQHQLLLKCFPGSRTVIVGDDRQAIYQFRGAHESSLDVMQQVFDAVVMPLTVTRRCPVSVTAEAARIVPDFTCLPGAQEGIVRAGAKLEWSPNAMGVARCNAPLLSACLAILAAGHPAHIQGRDFAKTLVSFLGRVVKFGKVRAVSELGGACSRLLDLETRKAKESFDNPEDVETYLAPMLDQIECLNTLALTADSIGELESNIHDLFRREDGMKFSTVHRAKGLEADLVYIIEPEKMPLPPRKKGGGSSEDWSDAPPIGVGAFKTPEQNVAYVAFTRAMRELAFVGENPPILRGGGGLEG